MPERSGKLPPACSLIDRARLKLAKPPTVFVRHFHHVRAPKEPIDRHIKPVRDLCEPVNVERFKPRDLKVHRAPAAKADAAAEFFVAHLAQVACLGKPIAEKRKI